MAKIYSKKSLLSQTMRPSKETISFLLGYSKALTIIKVDGKMYEVISN